MLQGWVLDNLETMFTDVNTKVGTIAGEVGQTPSSWNAGIFSMIDNLSDTVMVPIAGMIISAILCYELITMVMDKNVWKKSEHTGSPWKMPEMWR